MWIFLEYKVQYYFRAVTMLCCDTQQCTSSDGAVVELLCAYTQAFLLSKQEWESMSTLLS